MVAPFDLIQLIFEGKRSSRTLRLDDSIHRKEKIEKVDFYVVAKLYLRISAKLDDPIVGWGNSPFKMQGKPVLMGR